MDNYTGIAIFIGVVGGAMGWIFLRKTKEEKEYEQALNESLEDETLIDPETGARITMEQAESGDWSAPDEVYEIVSDEEMEKYFDEDGRAVQSAINYLLEQKSYKPYRFSTEEIEILNTTRIINKYDSWSYSALFEMNGCNAFVFTPKVELKAIHRQLPYYGEWQCMFWVRLYADMGHYYLREKELVEIIADVVKPDDDLMLKGYESFTFIEADNVGVVQNLLASFEGETGLEIEFLHRHLFIKNLKLVNLFDLQRMERIVKEIL